MEYNKNKKVCAKGEISMQIETYIDSLVSYAMNCGFAQPEDHQVLINRLLELLHIDDYTPSQETQTEDI